MGYGGSNPSLRTKTSAIADFFCAGAKRLRALREGFEQRVMPSLARLGHELVPRKSERVASDDEGKSFFTPPPLFLGVQEYRQQSHKELFL